MEANTKKQTGISVIIADNQFFTRKGIITVLKEIEEFTIIDEAFTQEELKKKLQEIHHDLLIVDFDYLDFLDVCELIDLRKVSPKTKILVATDNRNQDEIIKLSKAGIKNYILKNIDFEDFINAINDTLADKKYYSEEIIEILINSSSNSRNLEFSKLTCAEVDIVKFIAQGLTTKEIASKKHLSPHTINTHRKNIFKKLGVTSTSELIMYAIRTSIVDVLEYQI